MDVEELRNKISDLRMLAAFEINKPETRAIYEVALQIALLREDLNKPTWVAGPK